MNRFSILIVGWWLLSPLTAAADEPKPATEQPKAAAEELKAAADELKAAADALNSAADKLKAAADEAEQEREFACVDLDKQIPRAVASSGRATAAKPGSTVRAPGCICRPGRILRRRSELSASTMSAGTSGSARRHSVSQ